MGRKITILGMGMSARHRAQDIRAHSVGELWGINNGYLTFEALAESRGFDRVYELHQYDYLRQWKAGPGPGGGEVNHFATLAEVAKLVITGEPLPCITRQQRYPWDAVFRHHEARRLAGQTVPAYFRGTPSLMLAHALYEHETGNPIEEIRSWGIDMSDPAHETQLPSWAYWTGQCAAAGIRLTGTALAWMDRPELDTGLDGLETQIRERLRSVCAWGPVTPVVAAFATDGSQYVEHLARLKAQVEALGMEFRGFERPACDRIAAYKLKPGVIAEAMGAGHPVLYLDADDDLLSAVTIPAGRNTDPSGYDIMLAANPERNVIATPLIYASSALVAYPTKGASEFLRAWEGYCRGLNDHRALHCAYFALAGRTDIRFGDATPHLSGAFRQSPSKAPHHPRTMPATL